MFKTFCEMIRYYRFVVKCLQGIAIHLYQKHKISTIVPSNDLLEEIFLLLPVKTLIRFKCLSKQWRSTIESRRFAERQLKFAKRSNLDHPKVMAVSQEHHVKEIGICPDIVIGFRTICLESDSVVSSTRINIPRRLFQLIYVSESCDGLFCIHSPILGAMYVVNPTTGWLRQLPPARFQILMDKLDFSSKMWWKYMNSLYISFVKAAADDYKLVWLYNSDEYNSDVLSPEEVTKCEVFDFRSNSWRYLPCTPNDQISHDRRPVYVNESVYWLTKQYKIVALDIQTEKFRLLPKIHPEIASSVSEYVYMCKLDKNLCMWSTREFSRENNVIWRLNPAEDIWEKVYTIRSLKCSGPSRFTIDSRFSCNPVVICKNKKILFSDRYSSNLVKYDPETKISQIFKFGHDDCITHVPYFESLVSNI